MSVTDTPAAIEVYNSVGGAAFFQRLLQEWKNAGAEIVPYEAVSETDYRASRGAIGRLALRWRMYPGYAWTCWRGARRSRGRAPVRVVTTNPFFAPTLVTRAAGGQGSTINLLYDLYPEALIQAGVIARESWIARRCAAITRHALRECAATVFLGERLRAYAESTYGPARHAAVIAVGADGTPFRNSPPAPSANCSIPQVLYSGQMGSMHDVETLLAAWSGAAPTGVAWAFHASGAGYRRLQQAAGTPPGVTWGGALAEAEWQQKMTNAQVALVSIARGAERVVMPSKTYSALVAGQAILAVCSRESDLADLVHRHDCGWVVEPGDANGLRRALSEIAGDPVGLWTKRNRAFEAGHNHYDMGPVAAEWAKLFATLQAGSPASVPRSVRKQAA